MKTNNIDESDIELLLQRHTRHCVEQQVVEEGDALYSTYLRRANRRHYVVTACAALLMAVSLWGVTPKVSAQATSRATLAERSEAIATSDIIIRNL